MIEYKTIVIDPPWHEQGGGKCKRGADRHYPLLHTPEIPKVIMEASCWHPAWDCHLYLWATNNHLPGALLVVEQLGFRYITLITWAKDRRGLGRYYQGQTEHLVFAVRGQAMVPNPPNRGSTLVTAQRRRHSEKPKAAYDQIERVSPGPRLEMFARGVRPGWDVWGTIDPQWYADPATALTKPVWIMDDGNFWNDLHDNLSLSSPLPHIHLKGITP